MRKIFFIFLVLLLPVIAEGQAYDKFYWKKQFTDSVKFDKGLQSSSAITFSGNDVVTLSGDATVWDDIMFPFSTGRQGNANYPPFVPDSLYFAFAVDSAGNDAQYMYFTIQLPHRWKTGSNIYPHVHYKQNAPSGATPVFLFKYKWYSLTGTTQKGWKWYTMNLPTDTIRHTHQLVYGAGSLSASGVTGLSSILVGIVYLKSLAAGTSACNAYQFDIHIEIDGLGSRYEIVK